MLTLAAADTVAGQAAAFSITYSLFGMELSSAGVEDYKKLAQGTLSNSGAATIYTTPANTTTFVKSIHLANQGSTAVTGVSLNVKGTAAANRITGSFTIPANGWAVCEEDGWRIYDQSGALQVAIVPSMSFKYNIATSGDPGSGHVGFSNTTLASASTMRISRTTVEGFDIALFLLAMIDAIPQCQIMMKSADGSKFFNFLALGATFFVDNGLYYTIQITPLSASTGFTDDQSFSMDFYRYGTDGQGVPIGGSNGQVLTKNSGTNYDTSWKNIPKLAAAPPGRLTLLSGSPVMNATQASCVNAYYSPYLGDWIPQYDGAGTWTMTQFAELVCSTTDTTKNPAAIGANKVNDWFVWTDVATMRLCHGPDWSTDILRSAGTGLVRVNGILLNSTAITNACGAQQGTFIGTTRSDASGKLNWILGGNGIAGNLAVWNMYNRVFVASTASESTLTWTYLSNTVRAANGGVLARNSFVMGQAEDNVSASVLCAANIPAGGFINLGLAKDSTTTLDKFEDWAANAAGTTFAAGLNVPLVYAPMLGYHFISQNEQGDGVTTVTVIGGPRHGQTIATNM